MLVINTKTLLDLEIEKVNIHMEKTIKYTLYGIGAVVAVTAIYFLIVINSVR